MRCSPKPSLKPCGRQAAARPRVAPCGRNASVVTRGVPCANGLRAPCVKLDSRTSLAVRRVCRRCILRVGLATSRSSNFCSLWAHRPGRKTCVLRLIHLRHHHTLRRSLALFSLYSRSHLALRCARCTGTTSLCCANVFALRGMSHALTWSGRGRATRPPTTRASSTKPAR